MRRVPVAVDLWAACALPAAPLPEAMSLWCGAPGREPPSGAPVPEVPQAGQPPRSAVDLGGDKRDGLLIDRGGIPFVQHPEVRSALLIGLAGLPAFLAQEIGG